MSAKLTLIPVQQKVAAIPFWDFSSGAVILFDFTGAFSSISPQNWRCVPLGAQTMHSTLSNLFMIATSAKSVPKGRAAPDSP